MILKTLNKYYVTDFEIVQIKNNNANFEDYIITLKIAYTYINRKMLSVIFLRIMLT